MTIDDRVDGTGDTDGLPRWSVADVHPSVDSRSFTDAMERSAADADRLVALFDELGIRAVEPRNPFDTDGDAADRAIAELNRVSEALAVLRVYASTTVATDSRDDAAQAALFDEFFLQRLQLLIQQIIGLVNQTDCNVGDHIRRASFNELPV